MKKLLLLLSLALPLNTWAFDLKTSADSLERLLAATPQDDQVRRLELLNNLLDIDIATGKMTHIMPCFEAAVAVGDVFSINDIVLPMAQRYQRRGDEDSTKLWLSYNEKYLPAPRAQANVEYLQLMSDIRNYRDLNQLAKKMLDEQIHVDAKAEPYKALRILYTLGVIAAFGEQQNTLGMASSTEYYEEGFKILDKMSFEDGLTFKRQFFIGLAGTEPEYGRRFVVFAEELYRQPYLVNRKFYSRRTLLTAYDRILYSWQTLSRQEIEYYYRRLKEVAAQFPFDVPGSPVIYSARTDYRYYTATGQREKMLSCLDTLIDAYKSQGKDYSYYYYEKVRLLGELGRYKEGYDCAYHYVALKDSLFKAQSDAKMEELKTQYDVDKLEQKKEEMRHRLMFTLILVLLLIAIVTVLLIGRSVLRRKNRVLLEQLRHLAEELSAANEAALSAEVEDADGPGEGGTPGSDSGDASVGADEGEAQSPNPDEAAPEDLSEDEASTVGTEPSGEQADSENARLFGKINALMMKEKLYVDTDFRRDTLINELGINKNKLNDAISTGAGVSFIEYITDFRLKESLVIINDKPEIQLADVAERSGFGTYSTFYRAFYKEYGVSPAEYRRYMQGIAKP